MELALLKFHRGPSFAEIGGGGGSGGGSRDGRRRPGRISIRASRVAFPGRRRGRASLRRGGPRGDAVGDRGRGASAGVGSRRGGGAAATNRRRAQRRRLRQQDRRPTRGDPFVAAFPRRRRRGEGLPPRASTTLPRSCSGTFAGTTSPSRRRTDGGRGARGRGSRSFRARARRRARSRSASTERRRGPPTRKKEAPTMRIVVILTSKMTFARGTPWRSRWFPTPL